MHCASIIVRWLCEGTNSVIDDFPPQVEATLYAVNVLGIIGLFESCRVLSTIPAPVYDECGDTSAQSY